jgi:hypothetical protein
MFEERKRLLSKSNITAMDRMLDAVCAAVANGELQPHQASYGIKEVIGQIDSGNIGGAEDWFKNGLEHMKGIT